MYKHFLIVFIGCLYFALGTQAQNSPWKEVKLKGQGKITVYFNPIKHFFEKDKKNTYRGIEYELIQRFVQFTEKKYGIKIMVDFKKFASFENLYDSILVAPSGTFAVSSMSITPKRLRVLKFSPPYMPDTEVIVNSKNVPLIRDTASFIKTFDKMTAVVIKNTTYEDNLKKLKATLLPHLKIEYVKETSEISRRMHTEPNIMGYTQIVRYIGFRQDGLLITRQNLFKVKKIGRGVAFSKNSDWDEPIQLFFNDPSFKPFINHLIKKYLGNDEKSIFWNVSTPGNPSQQELALLNKEKQLQFLELRRQQNQIIAQNNMRNYLVAGFVITLAIALTFYYRFYIKKQTNNLLRQKNDEISEQREQLEKQTNSLKYIAQELESQRDTIKDTNQLLSSKNKKITDSIRSAKAIQHAILPLNARLEENFNDYFVIYKPKDIVSGDFYWLSDLNIDQATNEDGKALLRFNTPSSVPYDPLAKYSATQAKYCFLAVVDCTGHGVPGAFMSMIGFAYLNQIVNENHIIEPAQILQTLHTEIHTGLKQTETNNDEGMDICLCRIEQLSNGSYEVMFAGAKRPLYYVKNDQLHEIRGNAVSIGGWQKQMQKNFKTQKIELNKGDLLYLSTDGFIDTPNPERKNFSTTRLKELLAANAHLPLHQQKEAYTQALKDHQQDADQRDDITLIGIKF